MFEFTCPYCSHRSTVSDEYLGKRGPCVECGLQVVMPTRSPSGRLIAGLQSQQASELHVSPGSQCPTSSAKSVDASGSQTLGDTMPSNVVLASPMRRWIFIATAASALLVMLFGATFGLAEFRRLVRFQAIREDYARMKTIVDALDAYYDLHGSYPTPVVRDSAGVPLYSWRVLILPQLGYQELFDAFQLDQPWDSPANTTLVAQMPKEYCSVSSPDAWVNHEPNFYLIIGQGTLFPNTGPVDRAMVNDVPTMLVVQSCNGAITWSQPGDVEINKSSLQVGSIPQEQIGGIHRIPKSAFSRSSQSPESLALGVSVGGEELWITDQTPKRVVEALVTPNGWERLDPKEWKSPVSSNENIP
jgi:hypothetical protein